MELSSNYYFFFYDYLPSFPRLKPYEKRCYCSLSFIYSFLSSILSSMYICVRIFLCTYVFSMEASHPCTHLFAYAFLHRVHMTVPCKFLSSVYVHLFSCKLPFPVYVHLYSCKIPFPMCVSLLRVRTFFLLQTSLPRVRISPPGPHFFNPRPYKGMRSHYSPYYNGRL